MNEMIPISSSAIGGGIVPTVSARDLHQCLGVAKDFSSWVKAQLGDIFTQGVDFIVFTQKGENEGRARIEYALTLDCAKHIAMMSRTERGMDIRRYFIRIEEQSRKAPDLSSPDVLRTLLLNYTERVIALEAKVEEQKPAVAFHDAVRSSADAISIRDMAKLIGTGQNRLFDALRGDAVLMHDNRPYQQFIDRGYFRVVESTWIDRHGETHLSFKTLVTGKGQQWIAVRYGRKEAA